ncbi:MAG TPA: TonB family protein [Polyangiaceae bacterium]|jgi:TonB family protein
MKLALCIGSAVAFHVAVAVVAPVAPAHVHVVSVARETPIEVDEIQTKPVETVDDTQPPVETRRVTTSTSRHAAPAPHVIAVDAPAADSSTLAPVSEPVPPRFQMTFGGGGGGDVQAKSAPPRVDRTFAESEVTERAMLVSGPKPAYPSSALADGVELEHPLVFEIVVDTAGAVISVRPLGHAGYGFDEAAVAALHAFRFAPAKRDGELVRVRMHWTVDFHLT